MALEFFEGAGQTLLGEIAVVGTLGLSEDVIEWTVEGAQKVVDNAEKAWGKDGEITEFAESLPGMEAPHFNSYTPPCNDLTEQKCAVSKQSILNRQ